MEQAAAEISPGGGDTELDAQLRELRERIPGPDIGFVRRYSDGSVQWSLTLRADTPEHLVDYLRDAVADADRVGPA